ncbi:MAG: ribosomal protein S18-alanine N-acetyltransferase [Clostridia bacterium]|nr:ribosomal protein S18-alanine N-acetyltransferase [Clostridia bacterium]
MQAKHIDAVAELDKQCFTLSWSRALFESELNSSNTFYIVAICEEKIVGYCGIQAVAGEGSITNVCVLHGYRNKGIASSLLEKIISYGKETNLEFITLEVRESNINAIKLYEKFGFEKVGARKNYYSDNKETAILMTKQL